MRAVIVYRLVFGSLIATSLLLVSGCKTVYVPTSSNAQDFDTAKMRCQNDPDVANAMNMAIANATSPASSWYSASAQMYFKACMREQGWVPQSRTNQAEVEKHEVAQPPATAYTSALTSSPSVSHTNVESEPSPHTDVEIAQARKDAFNGCLATGRPSNVCDQNADQVVALMRSGAL
jgi:hypothetical protein